MCGTCHRYYNPETAAHKNFETSVQKNRFQQPTPHENDFEVNIVTMYHSYNFDPTTIPLTAGLNPSDFFSRFN